MSDSLCSQSQFDPKRKVTTASVWQVDNPVIDNPLIVRNERRFVFLGYELDRELGKFMVKLYPDIGAALVSLTLLMHPEHGKDMLPGMGINNSDFPVKINPVHTVIK